MARVVTIAAWLGTLSVLAGSAAAQPVVENERPMRFVLTRGAEVVGTRVGEDAETFTVQTASGLVRVRKVDIAYMDYRTSPPPVVVPAAPSPAPPPVAPAIAPAPAPAPVYVASPPPRRRQTLLRAGITGLAVSYAITAGIGAIASIWESEANWMLVPVAGPMIYYQVADLEREVLGLLLLSTIVQGASLAALIVGIAVASRGADEATARAAAPRLVVAPTVGPGGGGLAMSLRL
jgi:hypothetical protein